MKQDNSEAAGDSNGFQLTRAQRKRLKRAKGKSPVLSS